MKKLVLILVILLFVFNAYANDALSSKGHFISIKGYKDHKTGKIHYKYTISLPCFYTAPGNSPCDRGSMSRNGKGRIIPLMKRPNTGPIFDSTGRFIDPRRSTNDGRQQP